jgi:hypothetical protein
VVDAAVQQPEGCVNASSTGQAILDWSGRFSNTLLFFCQSIAQPAGDAASPKEYYALTKTASKAPYRKHTTNQNSNGG